MAGSCRALNCFSSGGWASASPSASARAPLPPLVLEVEKVPCGLGTCLSLLPSGGDRLGTVISCVFSASLRTGRGPWLMEGPTVKVLWAEFQLRTPQPALETLWFLSLSNLQNGFKSGLLISYASWGKWLMTQQAGCKAVRWQEFVATWGADIMSLGAPPAHQQLSPCTNGSPLARLIISPGPLYIYIYFFHFYLKSPVFKYQQLILKRI